MNSNNDFKADEGGKGLTNEEITITVIYYTLAFLIFVVSLLFITLKPILIPQNQRGTIFLRRE